MSLSTNPIDELTERPNDKFGRFLYDTAYILAILGGLWFPVNTFPDWLQLISKHMPTYNLKLLAIDLAQDKVVNIEAIGYLIVYSIIFMSIALFMNKKGDVS